MPAITSANQVAGAPLGDKHTMILFDNIEADGSIEYTYIVAVFDDATEKPCLFVAAEINTM